DLAAAQWRIVPTELRALARLAALLAGVAALGGLGAALGLGVSVPIPLALAAGVALPAAAGAGAWASVVRLPRERALARRRRIDRELPVALPFLAAIALAEPSPEAIVRELAESDLAPEIRREALWVVRDTDLLGKDILTALRDGGRRTPSPALRDLFQGIVTTEEGGGDLRAYLFAAADRSEREAAARLPGQMDRLAAAAESFVTVAVAFPLFLGILLAVFAMIGGGSGGTVSLLWLTVLGIVPAAEIGFALLFARSAEGGE
ncbi:MAG: type II secretion system F family protein, partial [Thermoplasmata archaeon]